MNLDTLFYRVRYDWEVAKLVFRYAEKYYGMDESYFYNASPATFKGETIPHPQIIEIWTRQQFAPFCEQLFRDDEYIAKYIDPVPDDTCNSLLAVLRFIDWALIRIEREAKLNSLNDYFADNPNEYYNLHMRKELLELYIFCRETPYKKQSPNEIILTINKGLQKSQRKITLPNFDNWVLRSALLNYCEEHLTDIHSIEEATAELKALKKGGRSLDDPNYTASYTGHSPCSKRLLTIRKRSVRDFAGSSTTILSIWVLSPKRMQRTKSKCGLLSAISFPKRKNPVSRHSASPTRIRMSLHGPCTSL